MVVPPGHPHSTLGMNLGFHGAEFLDFTDGKSIGFLNGCPEMGAGLFGRPFNTKWTPPRGSWGFQWKTRPLHWTPQRCLGVSKPGCLRALNTSGASGQKKAPNKPLFCWNRRIAPEELPMLGALRRPQSLRQMCAF